MNRARQGGYSCSAKSLSAPSLRKHGEKIYAAAWPARHRRINHGLTDATVEKTRGVFARFPAIEKAVLYGSRAKGNFKTGSDIDLTLYGKALTFDLRSSIASELDDLLLSYTIDLSIFAELNHAQLQEHIERVGVVFYERES